MEWCQEMGKKKILAEDAVTTMMYQEMPEPFVISFKKKISATMR